MTISQPNSYYGKPLHSNAGPALPQQYSRTNKNRQDTISGYTLNQQRNTVYVLEKL